MGYSCLCRSSCKDGRDILLACVASFVSLPCQVCLGLRDGCHKCNESNLFACFASFDAVSPIDCFACCHRLVSAYLDPSGALHIFVCFKVDVMFLLVCIQVHAVSGRCCCDVVRLRIAAHWVSLEGHCFWGLSCCEERRTWDLFFSQSFLCTYLETCGSVHSSCSKVFLQ